MALNVLCLSTGLWIQDRLNHSSRQASAIDRVWSRLEEESRAHPARLSKTASPTAMHPERRGSVRDPHSLTLAQAVVVEAQVNRSWQVIGLRKSGNDVSRSLENSARPIKWEPSNGQRLDRTERAGPVRGRLWLEGKSYLAVARPLPGDHGHSLLCLPEDEALEAILPAVKGAGPISLLTLVWTSLLLGGSAVLVLAPVRPQREQEAQLTSLDGLRQAHSLIRTRDAVIFGLAKLTESRDTDTGNHLERISLYCRTLAQAMRKDPRFAHQLEPSFVRLIGISSALHDIGKVAIEDAILHKPGPLTEQERERMQLHTTVGEQCIREIELRLGHSNFLQMAREIAAGHHEHWDGNGYPRGLWGDEIPVAARVVAVADVYDALMSRRVYKEACQPDQCERIILAEAGKQFDPDIVDVWLSVREKFRDIAQRFAESDPQIPAKALDALDSDYVDETYTRPMAGRAVNQIPPDTVELKV
jgi:HD-GYP domain-containing protein (c-di-GMP phosphodiesterase class II)